MQLPLAVEAPKVRAPATVLPRALTPIPMCSASTAKSGSHSRIRGADNDVSFLALLLKTHTRVRQLVDRELLTHGINAIHVQLLEQLSSRGQCTVTQLGRVLGYDGGYITRVVAHLEERELIRRVPDRSDGRVVWLKPTPQGTSASHHGRQVVKQCLSRLLRDFSSAEIEVLSEMLVRLNRIGASGSHDSARRAASLPDDVSPGD